MKYDSIAIMVKVASLEFDKLSNQILAEHDLSNSQFKILKYLLRHQDGITRQIDLEEYFSMRNPTVTGLLQNLEKKSFIERIENPDDRRSKIIKLTEKTIAMQPLLDEISVQLEATFTENLTDIEKEYMKVLLRKMLGKNE